LAPYKATHEERPIRRAAMHEMRKRGCSYAVIGRKFNISKNSVRAVLLKYYKVLGIKDVKDKGP